MRFKQVKVEKVPTFAEKYGKQSRYDKKKDYYKWNANVGRRNRINDFRERLNLDESVEITEDLIKYYDNTFQGLCIKHGTDCARYRAELLGEKYTGLEDDDF